jgi:hypothetical protein
MATVDLLPQFRAGGRRTAAQSFAPHLEGLSD